MARVFRHAGYLSWARLPVARLHVPCVEVTCYRLGWSMPVNLLTAQPLSNLSLVKTDLKTYTFMIV